MNGHLVWMCEGVASCWCTQGVCCQRSNRLAQELPLDKRGYILNNQKIILFFSEADSCNNVQLVMCKALQKIVIKLVNGWIISQECLKIF